MNPFSLDHIFHRSLARHSRAVSRNPRQVMTPITIPLHGIPAQLFRGFTSQASSTTDSLRNARLVPSSARLRFVHPSLDCQRSNATARDYALRANAEVRGVVAQVAATRAARGPG